MIPQIPQDLELLGIWLFLAWYRRWSTWDQAANQKTCTSLPPSLLPPLPLSLHPSEAWEEWRPERLGSNTLTATARHTRDSKSFSRRVRVGCPTASVFRWRLPSPESCQCREQHEVEQEKSPETAAAGVRRGDGGGAEAGVKRSRSWSKGNKKVEADGERDFRQGQGPLEVGQSQCTAGGAKKDLI